MTDQPPTTPSPSPARRSPLQLPSGPAICYSGYREGQSPDSRRYPSLAQIREDLQLLQPQFRLLRLYDCSLHAERVLQVIAEDRLPFQVLLGAYLAAEVSNPGCPWGGVHDEATLAANRQRNRDECRRLVDLAARHRSSVWAVAVGNEATVDWTDHLVPVASMIEHVRWVRARVAQPITFCENYVPWQHQLNALVPELDFIGLHTYPQWEQKPVQEAVAYMLDNISSVARAHPGKPIVVTEAGWTTASNGRGITPANASHELQALHIAALSDWARNSGTLVFLFEAFDEPWKGSSDPLEPEKHWGLYTVDRQAKPALQTLQKLQKPQH